MKNTITTLLFTLLFITAMAQAPVPTSWDFDGTAPNGWTTLGTDYYAQTSVGYYNTAPGGKLNSTGDYVLIELTDAPGPVTYYLRGASFSGGTFTVEESIDGNTWTDLRVVTAPNNSAMEMLTDNPNSASRFIRFIYTQKVNGNIALDDISIDMPPPGPEQEINIVFNSENVSMNGIIPVTASAGGSGQLTLSVENLGTVNDLTLSTPQLTGDSAASFSVNTYPSTVSAGGSEDLVIDFNPLAAGTHTATLSIPNNDANETPFLINLFGFGDGLATEPASQASNLSFTDIKSYRFHGQFTPPTETVSGYLVLRNTQAITDVPVDGEEYRAGDVIGTSKVLYSSINNEFWPREINANSEYHFSVFTFNGFGDYTNYNQVSPLAGSVSSADGDIGNYYNGIDAGSTDFITDLHNLIFNHDFVYYGNYEETMIRHFQERDTVNGQKVITGAYTGEQYIYDAPFSWTDYSREHTYPHSWMPTWPADDPEQPEYNDQHAIFPVNFSEANGPRGARPLGEVVNVTQSYLDGKLGEDANGNSVYEPRDQHKGDAARAMFYMCVAYHGDLGNDWSLPDYISAFIPYGQDQDVLKSWHWQDPPSNYEIARNDFVDSLQNNRNPFIDSVNWVCNIDFSNMNYITNPDVPCYTTPNSIEEQVQQSFEIFPNPSEGIVTCRFKVEGLQTATMELQDITGKTVHTSQLQNISGLTQTQVDLSGLSRGVYFLNIKGVDWSVMEKVVLR